MDRKAEILTHAADLLQTRGYAAFSYQDLSARLGIRKASIHHHFCSKEALGEALCNEYLKGLRAFRAQVEAEGGGAPARLDALFAHADCTADSNKMCPGGSLQSEWAVLPDAVKDKLRALDEEMLDWVTSILAEGRRDGDFVFEGSARDQAILTLAAVQGALQNARVHGKRVFESVVRQLKQSMKPRE